MTGPYPLDPLLRRVNPLQLIPTVYKEDPAHIGPI